LSRPIHVLIVLLLVNAALTTVHVVGMLLAEPSPVVHSLFDLDAEGTIPSWYASSLLLLTAWSFGRAALDGGSRVVGRAFLWVLSSCFLYLSLDESVGIHERITMSLRPVAALPRFEGDHGIWIPFYVGAGVAFAALTCTTWLRLWRHERSAMLLFFAGVAMILGGAVGIEILNYGEFRRFVYPREYGLLVAVEEFLEMSGASAMLAGSIRLGRGDRAERASV